MADHSVNQKGLSRREGSLPSAEDLQGVSQKLATVDSRHCSPCLAGEDTETQRSRRL